MKRVCVVAICVFWLSSLVPAQSTAPPVGSKAKYDSASRISLSGVVEDIEQRSLGGACKAPGMFVIVKANGQSFALQIAPKWFIDNLSWTFTKGEKLEITGWKQDNNEVVVRKITRAEWILEPRDDSGAPNWLWMPAPKDSGTCT